MGSRTTGTEERRRARRTAFAEVLREAREAVKPTLSQEKLAAAVDMDRTTISLIERAKQSPTMDTIWILCDEIQICPSELLARAEKRVTRK